MRSFIAAFLLIHTFAFFAAGGLQAERTGGQAVRHDSEYVAQEAQSSNSSQSSTPAGAERSVLEVQPGQPAIKNKDLYERSGYLHPFGRMPRYVLRDQKGIWTSPFHTQKADVKYWVIFGAATGALIATDKWTVGDLPNTSGQVSVGTFASRLGAAYS